MTELYHHGVKGMKWGVRRYQNYDGTYTQRGLKRYREAEARYDKSSASLKALKKKRKADKSSVSAEQMAKAKNSVRSAKFEMNKSYKQLKQDKRADQGKKLYQRGKTIRSNTGATDLRRSTIASGAAATQYYLSQKGAKPSTQIKAAAVSVGLEFLNEVYGLKVESDNKKLRAYYSH